MRKTHKRARRVRQRTSKYQLRLILYRLFISCKRISLSYLYRNNFLLIIFLYTQIIRFRLDNWIRFLFLSVFLYRFIARVCVCVCVCGWIWSWVQIQPISSNYLRRLFGQLNPPACTGARKINTIATIYIYIYIYIYILAHCDEMMKIPLFRNQLQVQ